MPSSSSSTSSSLHTSRGDSWTADITPYFIYLIAITTLGPLQFGFHLAELNAPESVIRCLHRSSSPTSTSPSLFPSLSSTSTVTTSPLPTCIPITSPQWGLVNGIFTLGGLLGAILGGPLSTHSGRLLPMRLTSLFFVLGAALEALAPTLWVLVAGRFLAGVGAGAAIVIVPIYTAEISPQATKGLFGASTQVMINLGILVAQVLGYFLSRGGGLWRVVLGVAGGIGVVQGGGLAVVPESPEWLAANGEVGVAKRVLSRIRGGKRIDREVGEWGTAEEGAEEYDELLGSPERERPSSKPHPSKIPIGIFQIIAHPDHYRAIVAVIGVMLAQQLCGINSIMMYSVSVLSKLLPTTAGIITVGVGVLNLIVTIACAPLSDKLGRKMCLLLSIAGMGISSLLLAFGLMEDVRELSAVGTLLFVASFAVGLGPVPFILASELVGPEAVGATQSWALAANWIATFLVAQFFPILDNALGKGKVYFLFAGMGAAFFGFVAWWVPETKGKKDADEVWGRQRRQD